MEIDVLKDAQRRIKVAAESLRHIGDSCTMRRAVRFISHVAVKNCHMALLNNPYARDQCQQSRFANSVRTDHADHATSRALNSDIVERSRFPIAMGNAFNLGDGDVRHYGSFTARSAGHETAEPVRTKPMPRTPVFTRRWYLLSTSGSTRSLTRNINFSRSSAVSTLFGVNWASDATKLTVAGITYCGIGSRIRRASSPSASDPAWAAGR